MARLVPGLGLEQQPQNAHHTEDDAETRIEIGLESRWENGIHDGLKPAHTANSGQLAVSEGSTRTWPLQKLRARQRGQFHCLFSLGRRRIRAIVFVKSPRFHGLKNSYSKKYSLGAIRPRPSRLAGSTRAERRRAEPRIQSGYPPHSVRDLLSVPWTRRGWRQSGQENPAIRFTRGRLRSQR